MSTYIQFERWMQCRLPPASDRRLVVLTGARQTGKTTLVRKSYPGLNYLTLDDLEVRQQITQVRSASWGRTVGAAILDEAQKNPTVFEKVKLAYDNGEIDFSVLTGSSQILLMKEIRESLAGRAFLYQLWPLMVSELGSSPSETLELPLLDHLLGNGSFGDILKNVPEVKLGASDSKCRDAVDYLGMWGGMPELPRLNIDDRRQWLTSYRSTFLERDLADLVRLSDLEPFTNLQKLCMLRTGGLLSISNLARDAHISAATARRYLEYLRLSFQVILLPPYSRNLTSAVVKSPKLYWIDLGLLRSGTRQWGDLSGELFETLVVGEVWKWVSTMGRDVGLSFYRTRSGLEVDLMVETPSGVLAIEIKNRISFNPGDIKGLRKLADVLGDEWRGGIVANRSDVIEEVDVDRNIWSIPVHRLLSPT